MSKPKEDCMKTFWMIGTGMLIALNARAQPPETPRQPSILSSPEIAPDRHVTFRLYAPKATEVRLTGEFVEGGKSLSKDEKGVWSITVGPIAPEMYHYNFIVDDVRIIDPSNPRLKTGSTPSTLMSILDIRGDHPRFYDPQLVAHGEIRTHWYQSKSLNALRRVNVYTPPGYDEARQNRYPVLYLLHGANLDETAWTRFGRVNLILDNLLAAGIESKYRVSTSRDQRAIMGLSMGGGQALGIGLSHPELFSYVGGFSAALRPAEFEKTFVGIIENPAATNAKLHLLWIGCGTEDGLFPAAKNFSEFLDQHKIKHTFHTSSGAHTFMVWRNYLNEVAPLLFTNAETSSGR
jgi:enterochelin esterase-like enzyme